MVLRYCMYLQCFTEYMLIPCNKSVFVAVLFCLHEPPDILQTGKLWGSSLYIQNKTYDLVPLQWSANLLKKLVLRSKNGPTSHTHRKIAAEYFCHQKAIGDVSAACTIEVNSTCSIIGHDIQTLECDWTIVARNSRYNQSLHSFVLQFL